MKLIIKNISKNFGGIQALNDFSAELDCGVYVLLGPNGCGKSTLINIITDNLKANSGEISFHDDGKEPKNKHKMRMSFREKLGFMPQYTGIYPNFTVELFMWYMAILKDVGCGMKLKEKKEYIKKQITDILTALELDDVSRRKINALSDGMKQRLALAVAVLGDPSILIFDEPTAGLDPMQRIAIMKYISKISHNKVIIIATHVVSDIEFIARDIIILRKGEIIDRAPPFELIKKIEGKVWSVPVALNEVTNMQSRFRVINIARDQQNVDVLLRILSENKPTKDATSIPPTLEDYYLYVFNQNSEKILVI